MLSRDIMRDSMRGMMDGSRRYRSRSGSPRDRSIAALSNEGFAVTMQILLDALTAHRRAVTTLLYGVHVLAIDSAGRERLELAYIDAG